MEVEEISLTLSNFAPLIQLWAGICLLFFYETLFKESPLANIVEGLKKLHRNFVLQYIDIIPKEEVMDVNEIAKDNWEEHLLPTIKNIASLTFFYAVFILFFIGIENHKHLGQESVFALQPINCFILLYLLSAAIFVKTKLFHTYWTPVICFAALVLYFIWFKDIDNFFISYVYCFDENLSRSEIVIFTLITLFSGLLLVIGRIFMVWINLKSKRSSIEKLDRNCKELVAVRMKLRPLNQLPKKLLEKIQPKINERIDGRTKDTNIVLQESIAEEILDEYKTLKSGWIQSKQFSLKKEIRKSILELVDRL